MPPAFDAASPELAEVYDDLPLWSSQPGQLLLDAVELRPEMKVLDLGCGTGFPLVELAERIGPRGEVHGVDVWAPALERARKKIARRGAANAFVHETDAATLPFRDGTFDAVVSNLGVNNFDDPPGVLAEARRCCRPDAQLVIASNVIGTMAEVYAALREALDEIGVADAAARVERLVNARTSVAKLSALVEGAMFAPREVRESTYARRFACGDALLAHWFLRLGFTDGWASAAEPSQRGPLFAALARCLDARAHGGPVVLTVPIVCLSARAV
jgi:arsenite methyltransferase